MALWKTNGFRLTCAVVVLLRASIAGAQQPATPAPGEKLALEFRSLLAQVSDEDESGYGFVVAQRGDVLTIVTADHVIRRLSDSTLSAGLKVRLFVDRGHFIDPKVLEVRIPGGMGDLAVLEVQHPNFNMINFPVAKIPLPQRTKAWRVGKDGNWVPGPPGTYLRRMETIWLGFADLDTPKGTSGGPVITDDGLIGMVEKQEDTGISWVLPINTIYEFFVDNGLPWSLRGDGTSQVVNASASRSVLSPLVDLTYYFDMKIECNTLDLNSFCQRAKRLFLEYKADVDKAGGQNIKDPRLISEIDKERMLMTPRSSLWPILTGSRPPIYFLYVDLFKTPTDAEKYMSGDLTISPNISWVFAATNQEQEHNLIFLRYNVPTQQVSASYSAMPINQSSDGVIASFEDLAGSVMLLFTRDGQASNATPEAFSFKDKQGRLAMMQGIEFQAITGNDRGKQVTYYKYNFP